MKKIWLITILSVVYLGSIPCVQAQDEEDFDRTGLKHLDNAYFKAIPQKDEARAKAEFAHAERAFRKAINKKPGDAKSYLHLGRTYFVQKKYHKAAELYKQASRIAPQDKKIKLRLASALEKAGRYEESIITLENMKAEETDMRVIRILDGFIGKMKIRAEKANNPDATSSP
jgi:cytochrome c-type biogenesis protein CcmH/NrfG